MKGTKYDYGMIGLEGPEMKFTGDKNEPVQWMGLLQVASKK